MKARFLPWITCAGVLLTGCHSNKNNGDVVSQQFVHKYGFGLSEQEWEELRRTFAGELTGSRDASFILDRHAIERSLFGKLCLAGGTPTHILPRKGASNSDVEFLLELAGQMGDLPGASI